MPLGGLATAGLIVGGVTGLAQLGIGVADRIKGGKKLKEAQSFYEQNKYEIPESARGALTVAERQASGMRLPGEDVARERMGMATSQAVGQAKQAATSASDVLGVLAGAYGQQMMGERDVVAQGARRYDLQQANLQRQLGQMAQYEDQRWQYNTLYPYQQILGQAQAYQARGAQEMSAGFSALGQTAAGGAQMASAQQGQAAYMSSMGLDPTSVSIARAQAEGRAIRRDLPSYGYDYGSPSLNVDRTSIRY